MPNFDYYFHSWSMPYWGIALFPLVGLFVFVLIVWSLYWKGRALWLAARRENIIWFVVLLLVNTLGILEILYIYKFSKRSPRSGGKIESKEV